MLDEAGFLSVTDRKKDLLKTSAESSSHRNRLRIPLSCML